MAEAAVGQKSPISMVFFGTPHFAAIVLEILAAWKGGRLAGVVTQPDRQSGRGHRVIKGECARMAEKLELELYQPASLRNDEAAERLKAMQPDLMVVAAYGLLIPNAILAIPPLGTINVHASLLPAYRGAAPIARAIMENWQPDAATGVSIMDVVEALDAGAVYAKKSVPIGRHTCQSLTDELARDGGRLLVATLDEIAAGTARSLPQDDAAATYARKLGKEDGIIDWSKSAGEIEARIRGTFPWPCAHVTLEFDGLAPQPVLLYEAEVGTPCEGVSPGLVCRDREGLRVAGGDKWLKIARLCKPGKKETTSRDFINGHLRACPQGICGKAY